MTSSSRTGDDRSKDESSMVSSSQANRNNIRLSATPDKPKFVNETITVEELGPPVLYRETLTSHKQLRYRLRELEKMNVNYDQIVLFFIGTPDRNGRSWHASCNSVDRAVNYMVKKLQIGGFLLTIHVGSRDEWLDLNNPFKEDPKINLQSLPTLWVWNSTKKLFGRKCLDLETVYLLLKD